MQKQAAGFIFLSLLAAIVLLLCAPGLRASTGSSADVLAQDSTDDPYLFLTQQPTSNGGYPQPTDAGYAQPTGPANPTTPPPILTPLTTTPGSVTPTWDVLTPFPTAGRNLFGTEDAEISSARVTPPATTTATPSPTPTGSPVANSTPTFFQSLEFNRQFFVIGFLIPLGLLVLGWLGYRLLRSGEFSGKGE